MSKPSKRRMCPAVRRSITPAECGENRGSTYACPATCEFNPLAPTNYDQLRAIEDVLEERLMERAIQATASDPALAKALQATSKPGSLDQLYAFFANAIFGRLDPSKPSLAERWEAEGFTGLKNDARVLLRAKMRLGIVLLHVHRVLDHERVEAIDLLADVPVSFVIFDRSLAATALRFATYFTWAYPLPHFWRLHGSAFQLPAFDQFDPQEVILEIAAHLGAPADAPERRAWLSTHFRRMRDAVTAMCLARRRALLESSDMKFGRVIYELRRPFAPCRETLHRRSPAERCLFTAGPNPH